MARVSYFTYPYCILTDTTFHVIHMSDTVMSPPSTQRGLYYLFFYPSFVYFPHSSFPMKFILKIYTDETNLTLPADQILKQCTRRKETCNKIGNFRMRSVHVQARVYRGCPQRGATVQVVSLRINHLFPFIIPCWK